MDRSVHTHTFAVAAAVANYAACDYIVNMSASCKTFLQLFKLFKVLNKKERREGTVLRHTVSADSNRDWHKL